MVVHSHRLLSVALRSFRKCSDLFVYCRRSRQLGAVAWSLDWAVDFAVVVVVVGQLLAAVVVAAAVVAAAFALSHLVAAVVASWCVVARFVVVAAAAAVSRCCNMLHAHFASWRPLALRQHYDSSRV